MNKFNELGLAESLLRAVADEGYTTPTPIQAEVIPAMLAGNDVLGIAQTGTGKTASFVLPALHQLAKSDGKTAPKNCRVLIMTPTRELAAQIADNIRNYSKFMKVSVAVVVGGVKPKPQIRVLAPGVDIVVATPGRLLDHMSAGVIQLSQTTTVVLDEADQMLDLGFMPAIRKIMSKVPAKRQTVMMSATMPPQIRKLALDFQKNPVEIAVAAISRPIERISQTVRHVTSPMKRAVLTDILSDKAIERAIVFTRTKRGADKVTRHLEGAGLSAAAIHGNKSQSQRERTLAAFKKGSTSILVATDIAARGIDIDDVSLVVNYELPQVAEAYVHRIGRTARAGRSGQAISLCDPTEQDLLRSIEKLIGNNLECVGEPLQAAAPVKAAPRGPSRRNGNGGQPRNANANSSPKPRRKKVAAKGANSNPVRDRKAGSSEPMAGVKRMLGNIGSTQRNTSSQGGKQNRQS